MALTRKRRLSLFTLALLLLSLVSVGVIGYRYYQAIGYNRALAQSDFAAAGQYDSRYGHFAHAYALQQQGHFQQAVAAYAELARDTATLEQALRYNLATLYLQQGSKMQSREQADLAMPLLELAKETYRELLRHDSDHWDAKYNLEQALALLPDLAEEEAAEEQNPEHSQRAVSAMQIRRELP